MNSDVTVVRFLDESIFRIFVRKVLEPDLMTAPTSHTRIANRVQMCGTFWISFFARRQLSDSGEIPLLIRDKNRARPLQSSPSVHHVAGMVRLQVEGTRRWTCLFIILNWEVFLRERNWPDQGGNPLGIHYFGILSCIVGAGTKPEAVCIKLILRRAEFLFF